MRETRLLQVSVSQADEFPDDDPLRYNLENLLTALEAAAAFEPDFVTFPELILNANVRNHVSASELAQPVPGPATDAVGEVARSIDSYVWLPMYERADGCLYNSVVLIDPEGAVRGTYRKVAPTDGEIDQRGVTPGEEFPVWDTEFGRVAASICWDVRYDEVGLSYGMQDVDIHFHPTVGLSEGKLGHWASYHGYHVVYCFPSNMYVWTPHENRVGRSRNYWGPTAGDVELHGDGDVRFAPAEINTDMVSISMAAMDSELDDVQRAYPNALHTHSVHEEAAIVCESRSDDVTMAEIVEEFDLETTRDYEDRVRDRIHEHTDDSPLLRTDFAGGA